jgi:hypothetical protein
MSEPFSPTATQRTTLNEDDFPCFAVTLLCSHACSANGTRCDSLRLYRWRRRLRRLAEHGNVLFAVLYVCRRYHVDSAWEAQDTDVAGVTPPGWSRLGWNIVHAARTCFIVVASHVSVLRLQERSARASMKQFDLS